MHYLRSIFHALPPARRLSDPQVQVWIMAGLSILLVIIGHVHAWSAAGEGKNQSKLSAPHLLLAGAQVRWSDDFATGARGSETRPVLTLTGSSLPLSLKDKAPAPPPRILARPAMELAAGQPWRALDRPLRDTLAARVSSTGALQIRLGWNGDSRGNAAIISRLTTASTSNSPATGLVIGNGTRSGDGQIEILQGSALASSGVVDIILIGREGQITKSQLSALAELLVHLEALSGRPLELAPNRTAVGEDPLVL